MPGREERWRGRNGDPRRGFAGGTVSVEPTRPVPAATDVRRRRGRAAPPLLLCLGILVVPGCASVPKETVELSMSIGDDLRELHTGYGNTVRLYFEQLRRRGLTVIDETWVPAYLDSFVEGGDLRGIVAAEDWDDLGAWAQAAIEDIDAKRSGFVDSLSVRETAMLMKIDDAFARTMNANANVTAYLQSLLKVEGMQDQMLRMAGLEELRDEITAGLAEASRFVAEATGTDGDPPGRED